MFKCNDLKFRTLNRCKTFYRLSLITRHLQGNPLPSFEAGGLGAVQYRGCVLRAIRESPLRILTNIFLCRRRQPLRPKLKFWPPPLAQGRLWCSVRYGVPTRNPPVSPLKRGAWCIACRRGIHGTGDPSPTTTIASRSAS